MLNQRMIFLRRDKKIDKVSKDENDGYKKQLAGQKSEVEDPEIEVKMEGLGVFWNKDDLNDGEKYLNRLFAE